MTGGAAQGGPPPEPGRLRRLRTQLLAGIGGLAAASLSLGLAIWEKREAPVTPEVAPGQAVEAGRWTVRLIGARLAAETPDGLPVRGGARALVVDLSLENRTAETSNLYADVVRIANAPAGMSPRPTYYLARDRDLLRNLQPRLAERVSAVWTLPAGAPAPDKLSIRIDGLSFKPRDNLYGAPLWTNRQEVGAATLPLATGEKL